ncbi:unnamed protein product [Linum trigynum]|uniref:Uncharacterized protein n=1 Tax=Linum trigynum TaxID=586398 RepID=A0AAV2ECN9_9ROSI
MWLAKPPSSSVVYHHCCLWVDQAGMLIQALADPAMATDFPIDSFEIFQYCDLPKLSGDHRILSDVIGRLHSISGIDHKLTTNGSTPKQVLLLENGEHRRVSITLWNELAGLLDRTALIQADSIEPVIIAVGGLMVGRVIEGVYTCSSSSGTRISVNPRIPEAYHLTALFAGTRDPVADLAIQFGTPEAAVADGDNRAKTIDELVTLYRNGGSVDAKYFCSGIIKSVESRSPWYKIQLILRDLTGEAPFIVFGSCGNNLVFTSAQLLAQRYPHRPGELPPELSALFGQFAKFEVKLPMVGFNGMSTGQFRVLCVVPQQANAIQAPVPHVIPAHVPLAIMDSVATPLASLPSQNNDNQLACSASPMLMSLPAPMPGSVPSSSSKGKEKVSGSLSNENFSPTFQIGHQAPKLLSQVRGPLLINEKVNGPESQPLSENVTEKVFNAAINDGQPHKGPAGISDSTGEKSIIADQVCQVQPVPVGIINVSKMPVTPSPPVPKVVQGSEDHSGHESLSAQGSAVEKLETPQSKVAAVESSTPPFTSPSASLLVSPLAKVKVEKLDASEAKQATGVANASVPFTIGGSKSAEGSVKRPSAKRRLYEA